MDSPFEKEIIPKDPDSELNYVLDWGSWLGAETIGSSEWDVPAGITMVSSVPTATTVPFRLSGGTAGVDYELINTITTTPSGQIAPRGVIIHVVNVERLDSILVATVGGPTSNSYGTLMEAKTYFSWRLYTDAWDQANDQQRETALLMATARLEQEDYFGVVVDDVQVLKWPRVKNEAGDLIRNYPATVIPQIVKNAQFEVAHAILANSVVVGSGGSGESLASAEIGPITLKYNPTTVTAEFVNGLPIEAVRLLAGLRLYSVLA